ncbi:MAG: 50S ribosomal protein L35 [Planctomycetes bacterium]|nr:50S ribosomal protein L35 [Planctomycetota bacterium]
MPKHKPCKGLLKRVKVTGGGKIVFRKSNTGHLKSGKTAKRLRHFRKKGYAKMGDIPRLERLLGRRLNSNEGGDRA